MSKWDVLQETVDQFGQEMKLTKRECEVLFWLARGERNQGMSDRLYINEKTLKNHVSRIISKFETEGRVEIQGMIVEALLDRIMEVMRTAGEWFTLIPLPSKQHAEQIAEEMRLHYSEVFVEEVKQSGHPAYVIKYRKPIRQEALLR